jgi:hypothetical protein
MAKKPRWAATITGPVTLSLSDPQRRLLQELSAKPLQQRRRSLDLDELADVFGLVTVTRPRVEIRKAGKPVEVTAWRYTLSPQGAAWLKAAAPITYADQEEKAAQ